MIGMQQIKLLLRGLNLMVISNMEVFMNDFISDGKKPGISSKQIGWNF
jgi:hypothetical protein